MRFLPALRQSAIRIFDPSYEVEGIRQKIPPNAHRALRGDLTRATLDALRDAPGPMTPQELARHVMAERGLNTADISLLQLFIPPYWRFVCQTASNRDPGSAWKKDPFRALGQACPGSEQEGPARVAQCPHERRSGARGRYLFAHRGKPGWHLGAVLEAPALVAGFDDFAVMGQAVDWVSPSTDSKIWTIVRNFAGFRKVMPRIPPPVAPRSKRDPVATEHSRDRSEPIDE
jgi:hypothetical protein